MGRAYDLGYRDGLRGLHDNIFSELSPDWASYEAGYDDGYEEVLEDSRNQST